MLQLPAALPRALSYVANLLPDDVPLHASFISVPCYHATALAPDADLLLGLHRCAKAPCRLPHFSLKPSDPLRPALRPAPPARAQPHAAGADERAGARCRHAAPAGGAGGAVCTACFPCKRVARCAFPVAARHGPSPSRLLPCCCSHAPRICCRTSPGIPARGWAGRRLDGCAASLRPASHRGGDWQRCGRR